VPADQPPCEACGGPPLFLGCLGTLNHFTCRDCGLPSASPDEPEPFDLDDDRSDRSDGEETDPETDPDGP
jgi:hypothetical protein